MAALLALAALPAQAWALAGPHAVLLPARDGSRQQLGTVTFSPPAAGDDGRSAFTLVMDSARFKDYFLSMKEFKCVEGTAEVFCHGPYPYRQPGSVTLTDLAWPGWNTPCCSCSNRRRSLAPSCGTASTSS